MSGILVSVLLISSLASAQVSVERRKELVHLLKQDCGSCHGMTLKGGLGKTLRPEDLKDRSDQFLEVVISEGIKGTAMPAWKPLLKPEEIKTLVEILRSGEAIK